MEEGYWLWCFEDQKIALVHEMVFLTITLVEIGVVLDDDSFGSILAY